MDFSVFKPCFPYTFIWKERSRHAPMTVHHKRYTAQCMRANDASKKKSCDRKVRKSNRGSLLYVIQCPDLQDLVI